MLVAKENVVFCLLQEKKRSTGTFKFQPSISLQKVKVETGFVACSKHDKNCFNKIPEFIL